MRVWCLVACFVAVAVSARADIYQYTDRNGVTHYTNVQPSTRGWKRVYQDARPKDGYPAGGAAADREISVRKLPDPERMRRYDAHIAEASKLYQLPVSFIRAVVMVESSFYPDAVSHAGAMGLMQLMPATARSMGVVDAFDPRQNVLGGTRFLRVLANKFNGDMVLTVAAYNAGEGAVQKYKGIPPYAETRRYVRKVLHHYYSFRNAERTVAAR